MSRCHDSALTALVGAILDAVRCRTRPRIVLSRVRIGTIAVEGEIRMFNLPVDKIAICGPLVITDSFGNPAPVDGVPAWSLSDPTGSSLVVAEDGLSATLASTDGVPRSVQLQVSADADLGAGVQTIQGVADVAFVAGGASIIGIPIALA